MTEHMKLSAFTAFKVHHHSPGQWKNPMHTIDRRCFDTAYWVDLAQTLERGGFDSLFFAHTDGVYDVYQGSTRSGIEQGVMIPQDDPTLLISALAAATDHLGFATTYSTTYQHPYHTAKLFSTLDHLSQGRIAWNIVTSFLRTGSENYGVTPLPHDERYERAEEYMSVVYKLWEHSWEDEAYARDRERDIYIHADRVHQIDHTGEYFPSVPGPHMCEPSIQRTPLLFQAGQSGAGTDFAAKHAEGIFSVYPTPESSAKYVASVRDKAAEFGRSRDDIKILSGVCVVTAPTDEEAAAKAEYIRSFASPDGVLTLISGLLGVDLSKMKPGMHLDEVDDDQIAGIRGRRGVFRAIDPNKDWTTESIIEYMSLGGAYPKIIGSPETVADQLEDWLERSGVDGFNLYSPAHPAGFHDFVNLVVPILQKRGRMRMEYEGSTIRENYFGSGEKRLRKNHAAFAPENLPSWRTAQPSDTKSLAPEDSADGAVEPSKI